MSRQKQRSKGTGSVYQNSRGQWVATIEAGWTERGTRCRITLKARTKAAVRARIAERQQRIAAEGSTADTRSSITIKRWADQWLEQRQRIVRPGTYVADRSGATKWIVPSLGHIRLDALVPADIRKLAATQEDAGLALATMQRTHAVLGKMLADAVAEGYMVPQRAREAGSPGSGQSPRQPLSAQAAAKILTVASSRPDASRWVAALVEGLRPAEALGLTWDMVDLKAETMTLAWQLKALPYVESRRPESGFRVPRGFESRHLQGAYHLVRPKTRAGIRVIPLVSWLAQALSSWASRAPSSPYGLVWPRGDGAPRSAEFDRRQWYEIVEEAGVTVILPDGSSRRPLLYEARHTAATLLLANGIDETTIKAVLGHSSVLSTQSYLHTDMTRTRAALAASAQIVGLGG
ncbi:MAG: site-specific integrase [Bifidobacterium tibiigranuli]|jgi:integrase|uniref:tyrosine-type recombinase/integrase n=1 Tax=Bifidobacterium tibiigranuli TaxID=2172043 RepID=UPI002352BDFD|nr:site-specific integrase [Bifidobacterium tibiigranuli]MCH4189977.1 site-specific integrase [Bifidobacterium tibiigranuli]MCH4203892.1 site-specific integrase [Bifidobacterium tibiigranuli]MCH4274266.1 site-specific integrase [Bifidobacterium tibiigranuli]MCI1791661.1 site-specific integrase [Bifidobacterium tibiigranuli]MCI1796910.1 site-specific integrase [Bifidobacterium tibiigranuli]